MCLCFRGELASTLDKLKTLANEEYKQWKQMTADNYDIKDSDNNVYCSECSGSNTASSSNGVQCNCGRKIEKPGSSLLLNFQKINITANDIDCCTEGFGAKIVMINFRRLLWYWSEYYLRRGRDRLSVEFSSHIPFKHWNDLVGK